jgi:hypothetical protein
MIRPKFYAAPVILAVLALLPSCGIVNSEKNFEIRVEGSDDMKFTGSYMTVSAGSSNSHSVSGTVPATYTVQGTMVSVAFQKQSTFGVLTVRIFRDGAQVKMEETNAEYGMVTIATQ